MDPTAGVGRARSASAWARTSSRSPTRTGRRLQPLIAPAFRKQALDARLAGIDAVIADEVAAIPAGHDGRPRTRDEPHRARAWRRGYSSANGSIPLAPRRSRRTSGRSSAGSAGASASSPDSFRSRSARPREKMKQHRAVLERVRRRGDRARAPTPGRRRRVGRAGPSGAGRPRARRRRAARPRARPLPRGQRDDGCRVVWAIVQGARAPVEWNRLRTDPSSAARFVDETLRLSPAVWGIPRTPSKPGVTVTARRNHDAHSARPGRDGVPARHQPRRVQRGATRCASTRPGTTAIATGAHGSLLAFGLGPRGCIGQHLALAEMRAVLPRARAPRRCRSTVRSRRTPASRSGSVGGLRGRLHRRRQAGAGMIRVGVKRAAAGRS